MIEKIIQYQPIIILDSPQLGENIGAVARVMMNFGLFDLRIVNPRDGWPSSGAIAMAAGAEGILENAEIYDDYNKAISDIQVLYATTARKRNINKKLITPKESVQELANIKGKKAILFGPERTGITNQNIIMADRLISIQVNPEFSSINLAQSVGIWCYEWFSSQRLEVGGQKSGIATKSELESLFGHLERELDKSNFFKSPEKREKMIHNIRSMLLRAQLSGQEVRTLRGIIRSLTNGSD